MDLVDLIVSKKKNKGWKLQMLYATVMTNYRQPLGDKAWDAIRDLFGDDSLSTSFAFLMGMATGTGFSTTSHRWKESLLELEGELKKRKEKL